MGRVSAHGPSKDKGRRRGSRAPHEQVHGGRQALSAALCPPENLLTGTARPLHLSDVNTESPKKGRAG